MKAKYLLMGLTLPLAVASCSDEVLETVETQSVAVQNGRRAVKNVVLSFEDSATRMLFDGKNYTPEAGKDKVGAMLMDDLRYANIDDYRDAETYAQWVKDGNWMDFFYFTEYNHTNFPFVFDGSAWKTESTTMSEGNYWFLYPMNEDGGTRKANYIELGDFTYEKGMKATEMLAKYQKFVGYSDIKAGSNQASEVSVSMQPILTYAGIRLHDSGNSEEVVLNKLVLSSDNGFVKTIKIDPENATHAAEYKNYINGKEFSAAAKTDGVETYRDLILNTLEPQTSTMTSDDKLTVNFKDVTMVGGDDRLVYFMAYPQNVTNAVLTLYTNKGIGTVSLRNIHDALHGSGVYNMTNDVTMRRLEYVSGTTPYIINVKFDNTSLARPTALTVVDESEVLDLIAWSEGVPNANLTATVSSNVYDFELTMATVNALKKNSSARLRIAGNPVIIKDAKVLEALQADDCQIRITAPVVVAAKATIEKAFLSNITVAKDGDITAKVDLNNVYVAEGATFTSTKNVNYAEVYGTATLNTANTVYAYDEGNIEISGDVNYISVNDEASVVAKAGVEYFYNATDATLTLDGVVTLADYSSNYGTLNVNKELRAAGFLDNNGVMNVADKAEVYNIKNYGTVNIAGKDAIVNFDYADPTSEIIVNGEMPTLNGAVGGELTVNDAKDLEIDGATAPFSAVTINSGTVKTIDDMEVKIAGAVTLTTGKSTSSTDYKIIVVDGGVLTVAGETWLNVIVTVEDGGKLIVAAAGNAKKVVAEAGSTVEVNGKIGDSLALEGECVNKGEINVLTGAGSIKNNGTVTDSTGFTGTVTGTL